MRLLICPDAGNPDPVLSKFKREELSRDQDLQTRLSAAVTSAETHELDHNNPHDTTADQVGLGRVDNTPDSEKSVATAAKLTTARNINGVSFDGSEDITIHATDTTARIAVSEKGAAGGVVPLDDNGMIPSGFLPSFVDDVVEASTEASFPTTGQSSTIYVALDTNKCYRWSGSTYVYISSGGVDSINGRTGVILLSKTDVGLGSVDNTSDADKPISNLTQAALNQKQASHANLTSLSNLAAIADRIVYTTGANTFALAAFTEAGRNLLAAADSAAQRLVLGLGNSSILDVGTTAGTVAAGDHNHDATYLKAHPSVQAAVTSTNSGLTFIQSVGFDEHGHVISVSTGSVPTASTTTAGIAQLTDSVTTTSSTLAATATAVKTAYSLAAAAVPSSSVGAANGVASLDANSKVPASQLPSYVDDVVEGNSLAAFPVTGEQGKIYVALDTNKSYRWSGSTYVYITSGAVDSVAGKTGVVLLNKTDVGLSNVDNTSDALKVVASAAKLTTARNINGRSFDGSVDVSVGLCTGQLFFMSRG